jgi:hypothetical protein
MEIRSLDTTTTKTIRFSNYVQTKIGLEYIF